jgi:hypothetical protein
MNAIENRSLSQIKQQPLNLNRDSSAQPHFGKDSKPNEPSDPPQKQPPLAPKADENGFGVKDMVMPLCLLMGLGVPLAVIAKKLSDK